MWGEGRLGRIKGVICLGYTCWAEGFTSEMCLFCWGWPQTISLTNTRPQVIHSTQSATPSTFRPSSILFLAWNALLRPCFLRSDSTLSSKFSSTACYPLSLISGRINNPFVMFPYVLMCVSITSLVTLGACFLFYMTDTYDLHFWCVAGCFQMGL